MKNKTIRPLEVSEIGLNTILQEIPYSELLTMLESIRSLQTAMHQLTVVLGNESIEVITETQSALRKLRNEISRVFASRYTQNYGKAMQNWENEGGRIEYV